MTIKFIYNRDVDEIGAKETVSSSSRLAPQNIRRDKSKHLRRSDALSGREKQRPKTPQGGVSEGAEALPEESEFV
ncbi:hypothetical protein [Evansella clarkii]|uniref:hypothetical protein n=1 Tax=Evansella clarkii TaxID=79879 RepID=UPI001C43B60C|nr:hypothetical protein [Evansella clarkii]